MTLEGFQSGPNGPTNLAPFGQFYAFIYSNVQPENSTKKFHDIRPRLSYHWAPYWKECSLCPQLTRPQMVIHMETLQEDLDLLMNKLGGSSSRWRTRRRADALSSADRRQEVLLDAAQERGPAAVRDVPGRPRALRLHARLLLAVRQGPVVVAAAATQSKQILAPFIQFFLCRIVRRSDCTRRYLWLCDFFTSWQTAYFYYLETAKFQLFNRTILTRL